MTNEQKYKTAEERKVAYKAYIEDFTQPIIGQFEWLALEAEYEKKPKPCPFCGGKHLFVNINGNNFWYVSCKSCLYKSLHNSSKDKAIAAHNRVCRAVEEVAKQSVTNCNQLGNAAKMREALSRILGIADHLQTRFAIPKFASALSATPRNCDVLSKDEALKVLDDRSFSKEDTIEWLYEEAKGETK